MLFSCRFFSRLYCLSLNSSQSTFLPIGKEEKRNIPFENNSREHEIVPSKTGVTSTFFSGFLRKRWFVNVG
jgi:hypothetical protein